MYQAINYKHKAFHNKGSKIKENGTAFTGERRSVDDAQTQPLTGFLLEGRGTKVMIQRLINQHHRKVD